MNKASATRDERRPQIMPDHDAIRRELHSVMASPHFCNSKRYPALLQYIVENTLAGRADLLKERTLGVEVFDRPPTYDTNTDTVVRYTAGEVRKRLSLYYHERGRKSSIRISLPVGSYIPEFLYEESQEETGDHADHSSGHVPAAHGPAILDHDAHQHGPISTFTSADHASDSVHRDEKSIPSPIVGANMLSNRLLWLAFGVVLSLVVFAGLSWRSSTLHPQTAVDDFWRPVLRDQRLVVLCSGGSAFAANPYTGNVATAGKDTDYPFVSMQIASAMAQISGLLERSGAASKVVSSAATPLTDLREHSVILIGGYNNQWTMRLLQPLRFHFTPGADESIVDQMRPQVKWARDASLPYSSADDYALVARYRDTTTGNWVVVLAGVGRNGSEAAAQFVASPHYMQMLQDAIGKDFTNKNIEAVLKISVIDGKTGAPSILAVHSW